MVGERVCAVRWKLEINDEHIRDGSLISVSSSSPYSVPPSVTVPAVTTLSRGVSGSGSPSSPLSCVNALLSLSPPTNPASLLWLFPGRSRFLPFAGDDVDEGCCCCAPRFDADDGGCGCGGETGEGDAGGEPGVEGADAVLRMRRCEMMVSMSSSYGRWNSERKKGWFARFSEGKGDGIGIGSAFLEGV